MTHRVGFHAFAVAVLVGLGLALSSCASSEKKDLIPDPEDAGPVFDAAYEGEFGEPCADSAECESGICLDFEDGPGWCSETCSSGCPAGFACSENFCRPSSEYLCMACDDHNDCGGQGNRCVEYESGKYCASDCSQDSNSCGSGFRCGLVSDADGDAAVCISESGSCCIDGDGDFRGRGDDCRGVDCDDSDSAIFDKAEEICDGKDNDCDGSTDVDIVDCGKAECREGSVGYEMRAAETCAGATCQEQPAVLCGQYTCENGGAEGERCATSCDGEDNGKCRESAHCEASVCVADLSDGESCNEDSDCQSGHCQGGYCCAFGDCCQQASDCPSFGSFDPVCENPSTCQGARGEAVCTENFTCATNGSEQDDSACSTQTVAKDCDFYLPVFCTGEEDQSEANCPDRCDDNSDCDSDGYCDEESDECVEDLGNGESCNEDAQCQSGHCENGFCCEDGDCCQSASDCPSQYSEEPVCIDNSTCQGLFDQAQCINFECSTLANTPNDSDCSADIVANQCGPYPAVRCTGGIQQTEPECADSCASDSECDPGAFCNSKNECEFDGPDGSACSRDSQCQGGRCENGFCCASGDCCAADTNCSHLGSAAVCDSQSGCQGSRVDGVCGTSFSCSAVTIDDDSACEGLESNDCGVFPSLLCSNATNQPADQASLCSTTCNDDNDCDPSANCDGSVCVPDAGQGGFCNETSDCGSGLFCVDNVCCNSSCEGECEACDLPGSGGTCSFVEAGEDPDAECDAVDCSGHYFGWEGDTCFTKADLSAAAATCNGNGQCENVANECSSQSERGSAVVTCDSTCQEPDLGTCTGVSEGQCNNLELGSETCGEGVCETSVARCINGQEQSCIPNMAAATAEICDGLDNNCNGSVDDGLPGDRYETNNSCASNAFLGLLGENLTETFTDMTLYSAGDEDWYRQLTTENFDTCTAGVDEEYQYTVTMSPPSGKDYDLQLCYNNFDNSTCSTDCFSSVKGGDQTESISVTWAGPCGGVGNDGLNFFIRVYPFLSANSCENYELSTTFTKTN